MTKLKKGEAKPPETEKKTKFLQLAYTEKPRQNTVKTEKGEEKSSKRPAAKPDDKKTKYLRLGYTENPRKKTRAKPGCSGKKECCEQHPHVISTATILNGSMETQNKSCAQTTDEIAERQRKIETHCDPNCEEGLCCVSAVAEGRQDPDHCGECNGTYCLSQGVSCTGKE